MKRDVTGRCVAQRVATVTTIGLLVIAACSILGVLGFGKDSAGWRRWLIKSSNSKVFAAAPVNSNSTVLLKEQWSKLNLPPAYVKR